VTPAGALVVDASVVVKWYVPEPGSAAAASLLGRGTRLLAPDLVVGEVGNVLWKKVRGGELSPAEAGEVATAFTTACPVHLHASQPILRAALDVATALDRAVYDSLYLVVAVAEGCPFVTADERLANALRGTTLEQVVQVLGQP
jgi:predicted nucleic acid-binding protein